MEGNEKKITGITGLREDLLDVYQKARKDEIPIEKVKEFANVAGKILKTAHIQISYQALMKTKVKIPFLEK